MRRKDSPQISQEKRGTFQGEQTKKLVRILDKVEVFKSFWSTVDLMATTQVEGSKIRELFNKYHGTFINRVRNEGGPAALKYYKQLYHISKCISIGSTWEPIPFCRSSKEGIPRDLLPFVDYLRNTKTASLTLTFLSFHQAYRIATVPNFEDILQPWTCETRRSVVEEFRQYVRQSPLLKFIKEMDVKKPRLRIHATGAQGVFGHMYYSQLIELAVLTGQPKLQRAVNTMLEKFGNQLVKILMTLPNPKANDLAAKVPHCLRRLEVLQEQAGKNRFIVLADF
jgi:hypothetical protein